MKFFNKQAFKIAIIFLIISFLWILYSDKVLLNILKDPEKLIWLQTYKSWFYIFTASVIIYLLLKREIVENYSSEENLKIERSKYKTLFENANDAIFILDSKNCFVDCNNKTLDIFQCTREQLIGKSPSDVSPEYETENVKSNKLIIEKSDLLTNGKPQKFDWIHKFFGSDKKFYTEVSMNKIRIGKSNYVLAIVRDITERKLDELNLKTKNEDYEALNVELKGKLDNLKATEEELQASNKELAYLNQELRQSEERYKQLSELNHEGIIIHNNGIAVNINKAFCDIFGYDFKELLGINVINKLLTKESVKKVWEDIETGNTSTIIHEGLKKDGTIVWVEVEGRNIKYLNQKAIVVILRDITDKIEKEQELKESEAKYRMLVENGPSVFWVIDKKGKTKYISPNISKIFGFSPNEIYKNGTEAWFDRIHKQDIENVLTNFKSVFTENKRFDVTYRIKNKKGTWIWLQDVGKKYINYIGEELAYGVFTDITEKKQAQQKVYYAMINAEERERSRVAKDLHDGISPILAAIKLYIQSLLGVKVETKKMELITKIEQTINEAIQSINDISNNLSPHILQNFGLSIAVESFVNKILDFKKINISISSKIKDQFSENIEVALYRITTELINNTLKYAKAKNIIIEYNIDEEFVQMKYTDDGVGFDIEKVLKNRKGMGIFNMTNRIKSLNGKFNIKSQLNKGIEVEISVPLNE